ncbi:hypothetical protein G184_gp58 [Erwinia phage ENT90]|uniref:Uncharacterized protein n=1 Tax=Erwinia phage ENT90 TaxID=947843 RepID=F1BUU5_9CAUD|nr:hypothetical protein G184_gp58 [Erwinia phage ENT90]ADX32426.1 hypothetical protein [Erwinia phage ENT90]
MGALRVSAQAGGCMSSGFAGLWQDRITQVLLFFGGDIAIKRLYGYLQHQGNLMQCGTVRQHPFSPADHFRRHYPSPAPDAAFFPCRRQSCTGTLNNQLALHFRQRPHNMKKEAAHWRTGINAVGQAAEVYSFFAQFLSQHNQMAHAAAKTIQLPHHQCVAFLQTAQCFFQSRPV